MKINHNKKEIHIHICDYGCGQEGKYQLKNKKWCCSKSQNMCPSKKERATKKRIGVKNLPAQFIETNELCSFGCGKKANFIYKNGSYCCKNDWHRCPGKHDQISKTLSIIWSDVDRRKHLSQTQRKDLFAVAIPVIEDDKICQDCGKKANFWFKTNNRYSCSNRIERCPVVKNKIKIRSINLWKDEEFRNKVISSQDYNDPERRRKLSEANKGRLVSKETREIFRRYRQGKTFEELFGKEKAQKLKIKASQRILGKTYIEL
jgi:hypothetical protein